MHVLLPVSEEENSTSTPIYDWPVRYLHSLKYPAEAAIADCNDVVVYSADIDLGDAEKDPYHSTIPSRFRFSHSEFLRTMLILSHSLIDAADLPRLFRDFPRN